MAQLKIQLWWDGPIINTTLVGWPDYKYYIDYKCRWDGPKLDGTISNTTLVGWPDYKYSLGWMAQLKIQPKLDGKILNT